MIEDEGMDEAFAAYQDHVDYLNSQDALPPHKRDGYAERMAEQADDERKRLKEESCLKM